MRYMQYDPYLLTKPINSEPKLLKKKIFESTDNFFMEKIANAKSNKTRPSLHLVKPTSGPHHVILDLHSYEARRRHSSLWMD